MRICKFVVSLILSALMIIGSVSAFPAPVPAEQGAVFKDGMAQQIIPYSDPTAAGYSNDNSEILRFAVYVETDHDTDLDGKRDLVKAFVQVPRLTAEVSPSDAADPSVKWSSSNEKAATVDQNGIVKAVGAGTANIQVVTNDGEKKAVCTVTVKKAANTLKISGKTANVKAKLLKKKAVTLKAADMIRFADKGQGSRTYRLAGVKKAIYKKYFKINAKTGKLTIGKGLRKGTYQVKIGIRAKGDTNYMASPEKTATAKIIVQ